MTDTTPRNPAATASAPDAVGATLPETVVSSRFAVQWAQALRDLWEYRDLFAAFVRRDLTVRYRQTALGIAWVVLQPVVAGGVLAAVFRQLGLDGGRSAMDSLLFYLAGLVPWMAFASAVQKAAISMEINASLVAKVYFPRLAVPGAYVATAIIDYLITYVVLVGVAAWAGRFSPGLLAAMPMLLLVQTMAAAGLGFFFTILDAQYRDIRYVVPFLLTLGLFVTVLLPLEGWGGGWRMVLSFNPMAAVIETYRAVLTGHAVDWLLVAKGACSSAAMLVFGTWFFRVREARLVDIL